MAGDESTMESDNFEDLLNQSIDDESGDGQGGDKSDPPVHRPVDDDAEHDGDLDNESEAEPEDSDDDDSGDKPGGKAKKASAKEIAEARAKEMSKGDENKAESDNSDDKKPEAKPKQPDASAENKHSDDQGKSKDSQQGDLPPATPVELSFDKTPLPEKIKIGDREESLSAMMEEYGGEEFQAVVSAVAEAKIRQALEQFGQGIARGGSFDGDSIINHLNEIYGGNALDDIRALGDELFIQSIEREGVDEIRSLLTDDKFTQWRQKQSPAIQGLGNGTPSDVKKLVDFYYEDSGVKRPSSSSAQDRERNIHGMTHRSGNNNTQPRKKSGQFSERSAEDQFQRGLSEAEEEDWQDRVNRINSGSSRPRVTMV